MKNRNQFPLTDEFVRAIIPPASGSKKVYDGGPGRIAGFGVLVTHTGRRTWFLNYPNPQGRERRITIGPCSEWPAEDARWRAAAFKRQIALGHDPLAERDRLAALRRKPLRGPGGIKPGWSYVSHETKRSRTQGPAYVAHWCDEKAKLHSKGFGPNGQAKAHAWLREIMPPIRAITGYIPAPNSKSRRRDALHGLFLRGLIEVERAMGLGAP
jgi:hypothetical protein